MPDPVAYKVMTTDERESLRSRGSFHGSPADVADGFIHLSSGAQLAATVEKHFGGQTGLFLATVDLAKLGDAVRWEPSRGGQLFPHLYGTLPAAAVVSVEPLGRAADGTLRLAAI